MANFVKAAVLAAVIVCTALPIQAGTVKTFSNGCEPPSTRWSITHMFFDDNGQLKSASGIDCDGNIWAKNYDVYTGPVKPNTNILDANDAEITVASDVPVTLQIVDLQAGENIGNTVEIAVNDGTAVIDISQLETGTFYGVHVFKDGGSVDVLYFTP